MWFNILPSFAIIWAFMGLPHGAAYWLNYGVVGNFFRRSLLTREEQYQYLRDYRLAGDPYTVIFDIPDAPESKTPDSTNSTDSTNRQESEDNTTSAVSDVKKEDDSNCKS